MCEVAIIILLLKWLRLLLSIRLFLDHNYNVFGTRSFGRCYNVEYIDINRTDDCRFMNIL